ncbi:MAG: hypothetical protein IJ666_07395 [Ruminococcus sp.]|nr:hypothetical protein [Ruminococcus sp.]
MKLQELDEIYSLLKSLNIPVAYLKFDKPQKLPFMVYYEAGTEIKGADGHNLYREIEITVELYSDKKNTALERKIEALFSDREIHKDADIYISDEDMFITAYSFTIYQYI